jgi:hypothetical protein
MPQHKFSHNLLKFANKLGLYKNYRLSSLDRQHADFASYSENLVFK